MKTTQSVTYSAALVALLAGCASRTEPAETPATAGAERASSRAAGRPGYPSGTVAAAAPSEQRLRTDSTRAEPSSRAATEPEPRQPVAGRDEPLRAAGEGRRSMGSASGWQEPVRVLEGKATFYDSSFAGQKTASGEPYNPEEMTAASEDLPLGSLVRVVRADTGASVLVRINDRLPEDRGAVIDVSASAAEKLDMKELGIVPVRVLVMSMPEEEESGEMVSEQEPMPEGSSASGATPSAEQEQPARPAP